MATGKAPWWTKYALGAGAAAAIMLLSLRRAFASTPPRPTPLPPTRPLWDFVAPVKDAQVTSGWWRPREYRDGVHEGLDIRASVGTRIYAIADGVVTYIDPTANSHAGIYVTVKHEKGLYSRYLHLSRFTVKVGQPVKQGELIAYSGRSSKGMNTVKSPHLHFDLKLDERFLPLYERMFGQPTTGFSPRRKLSAQGGFEVVTAVGVPAEPFIPAHYTDRVIKEAAEHHVPMYGTRREALVA
jgi:murein DD-endopeptidase MepM/ murein hydrolase activator NlpD